MTMPSRRWPTAKNSSRRENTSLTGPPCGAGERGDVPLEVEVALGAEAAAEERHDHAHVRLGQRERLGDARPGRVRHLRRRPDRHAGRPATRRRSPAARSGTPCTGSVDVAALDDDVGARERRVDVALDDRREAEHVAVRGRAPRPPRSPPSRGGRAAPRPRAPPRSRSRRAAARARPRSGQRPPRDLGSQAATPATMSPSKRTVSRAKRRRSLTLPP